MEIFENIISEQEEIELVHQIDSEKWMTDLKRRVQHYGYRYDYKAHKIDSSMKIGGLAEWIIDLINKLSQRMSSNFQFDQVIINEYLPGQGIAEHIDCVSCFADGIYSLTLNSGCTMEFLNTQTNEKMSKYLHRRSLLKLEGYSRYYWKHGIKAVKNDWVNGQKIPRGRRISITCRKVIDGNI